MIQEIYVIDEGDTLTGRLVDMFSQNKKIKIKKVKTEEIDAELKNIPEIIILNADSIAENTGSICEKIRNDEDNSITPIVVITTKQDKESQIDILKKSVEYIITTNTPDEIIYYTITNMIRLLHRNRRISPLTGLPGNVQIHAELKKRLSRRKEFAVLYVDLDNFKSYNDVYGFLKGDEVIKLAARVITESIHTGENPDAFIGHIGGDDFVAITDAEVNYEKICQDIITTFDKEILNYFNEQDIERGYLEIANRKGILEQFTLTSISIGVVVVDCERFHNILEIGEVGAQVKHVAKSVLGSSYAIDRRG